MILRKVTAAVVPLVAALTVGAGATHAEPAAAPVPNIGYEARLVGNQIVTTLTAGTFEVRGDAVGIKDEAGNVALTLPLAFRQDGLEYPMPYAVREAGRVLELTVVKDATRARPVATPVASPYENQRAMEAFLSQFGIATAVGGFIGTIIGALVGLTGIISGPGVIASVIAGAGIGAIIGTIVAGGPTLIVAGIDLLSTLHAAPGTTKWMDTTGRPQY
ncbi:ammonium transporter [Nocardia sp. NBC_00508]|uniref:ammonium transporter n=1 Tax=Nocardia sp. NBC_00508 TaxID=2975992 RepID=UPI002E8049DA|nr:ammonium transporter [Nocardia sp. NBC_00508]WUD63911.1 ammonium transporter [Nocardia sp. NBC_00508]